MLCGGEHACAALSCVGTTLTGPALPPLTTPDTEIHKYNIPDYRPRQEWFRKAVHKVRQVQRLKKARGFAFSQSDTGQLNLIRSYDTTRYVCVGV